MTLPARLLWLCVAGAAGTLARYGLAQAINRASSGMFPWGTLVVNTLGCLLFGLVWALAEERSAISTETRVVLLVGFMGAFTTFSTFAADTGTLLRGEHPVLALANVLAENGLGLAAFFAGLALARLF
jgi:CrcB protein